MIVESRRLGGEHPRGRAARRQQQKQQSAPDIVAQVDPQDYDVVADLDELLASDESNLWDDNTTL